MAYLLVGAVLWAFAPLLAAFVFIALLGQLVVPVCLLLVSMAAARAVSALRRRKSGRHTA